MRYNSTPYAGNKSEYKIPTSKKYDIIVDFFAGSLGGTLELAIKNPHADYYVAEASRCQRALIKAFGEDRDYFKAVYSGCDILIKYFFQQPSYEEAAKWFSSLYQSPDTTEILQASLSVMRRFFFSSILRTTPGTGDINVWISTRKILGDKKWAALASKYMSEADSEDKKSYNALLNEFLFRDPVLEQEMRKSVSHWYKTITPVLDEWYDSKQTITVFSDYSELLEKAEQRIGQGGKALLYIDPPYYNDAVGSFYDEDAKLRTYKQTACYENHHPQSLDTWSMFESCADLGYRTHSDMVLCNYSTYKFNEALQDLDVSHRLEFITKDKVCRCTGKISKYFKLPLGKESVIFAEAKY